MSVPPDDAVPASPPTPGTGPAPGDAAPVDAADPWFKHVGNLERSLPEVHGSVPIPVTASFWRKLFAFAPVTGPPISRAVRATATRCSA